jgi:ABC-type antimicrobial peptide transport system permease subunit
MSWRDVVVLAARSVARRPGRAALTVLAIALAAALFSALLTVARTAEVRVLDQLADGGPLAGIEVAPAEPDPTQVDQDDAEPGDPRDLDDAALAEIRRLGDVASVIPLVSTRVAVVPPDPVVLADGTEVAIERGGDDDGPGGVLFETLVGADVARADDLPISVLAGRLPQPGSLTEVAVTPTWLARFGLERADADRMLGVEVEIAAPRWIGAMVRGRWTRAEIVGVVAQEATSGALLAPEEAVAVARAWTLSGETDEGFDLASSPYSGAFVVARGLDRVAAVRNGIHDIGYATSAPENLIASVQRYLRVVEIVLSGIGVIALAIATMGITNALLAAVRERRREIGVLKAIGARDRDVLRLFLVEAGVLGVAGGVLGTLLGLGLASLVGVVVNDYLHSQGLAGVRPQIPLWIAAASVVGAGLLAVVAGSVPARRAARLPAREAVEA